VTVEGRTDVSIRPNTREWITGVSDLANGEPFVLQVVEADAGGIGAITSFMNPALFRYFEPW
jgi:hypothetical protein